ncbi:hypothetical protein [Agrobacterium pusense]|uniref:hypothetical protein n=1 Tax=Agrobacterium pusense TaxID=648995 RepID=UPI001F2767B4|nr:hypothetical protein [Agrobacterium pusense]
MVEEKAAFREGEASQAEPAERQLNRLDELTRKGKMNGKCLLHMYHEQTLADELARDRHTEAPAIFIAVALFVVVFVVGAALDTAWVHLQQWHHVAASYWPF